MQLQSFLHYLEFEKRYSKHTLLAYETDLNQFIDFIRITYQIQKLTEIESTHIRSWMVDLIEQKISSRSINSCLLYTSPSPRDATLSRMPSSA